MLRHLGHLLGASEFNAGLVRNTDIAARYGGDELVVIAGAPVAGAADGVVVNITTSIGIACFPEDGRDVTALISCADHALYRAKAEGKNRIGECVRE